MKYYHPDIVRLMNEIPPDGWTVVTTFEGLGEEGDILTLEEALFEFAVLHQGEKKFDSIEIAPMWMM